MDSTANRHPLLTATKRDLEHLSKDLPGGDRYGIVSAWSEGTLPVRASPALISRALEILRLVIKRAEDRSWRVIPKKGERPAGISVAGQMVQFRLSEQSKGVRLRKSTNWGEGFSKGRVFRFETTGQLCLQLLDYMPKGAQRNWHEGPRHKLEDLIEPFLNGVLKTSIFLRDRERRFARGRRNEERHAQRYEVEAQHREELQLQLEAWQRTRILRGFIAEVRQRAARESSKWPAKHTVRWIMWAERLARKSDPLSNGQFKEALKDTRCRDATIRDRRAAATRKTSISCL